MSRLTALRIVPRSLHARMLMLSVLASVMALLIAGWAIAGVLERFVTEGLDERLDAQVALLASTVDADGRVDRLRLTQGIGALQGGPGWRWRIVSPMGTIGSRDFPSLDPRPPRPEHRRENDHGPPPPEESIEHVQVREGVGRDHVAVHARQLTMLTKAGPVTLTAAAPRDVVRRPIRGALVPLLAILAVLAVLLALATLLQLRLGLSPLRRLRDQMALIRAGERSTVDEDQPDELRPLALELNALTRQNAAALTAARQSAANLAHALKTPVAALALDARDDPAMAAQVSRIDATIRHHLARARVQAVDHRAATSLAPALTDLIDTVRRLHGDRSLTFTMEADDSLRVALDPQDLDELLGNLLDNAARHANCRVSICAAPVPDDARHIRVEVCDDGPGIPASERARVAQPGVRLDERGDGHGFGLAIAVELTAIYGGQFTLEDSPLGGLCVAATLPASQ